MKTHNNITQPKREKKLRLKGGEEWDREEREQGKREREEGERQSQRERD